MSERILILSLLVSSVAVNAQTENKVKTEQIMVDGIAPLVIVPMPDQSLTKLHHKIKNNSNKAVEAFGVEILVTRVADNGNRGTSLVYMSRDTALYDGEPLAPGAEMEIPPQELAPGKGLGQFTDLNLKLDFIVFSDGAFLGKPDGQGAKTVFGRRAGVEKFKKWAKQYYKENDNSLDKLIERIKDPRLTEDPALDLDVVDPKTGRRLSGYESAGAHVYRNYLLYLSGKDRDALEKKLKEDN